jgi:hypothetical protein
MFSSLTPRPISFLCLLSPWAKALQSLVSSAQLISFLQSLTGIEDLIPMKVSQEELQWAGSNVIGVTSGGFLLIHNDVSTHLPSVELTMCALVQHVEWIAPSSQRPALPQRRLATRVVSSSALQSSLSADA